MNSIWDVCTLYGKANESDKARPKKRFVSERKYNGSKLVCVCVCVRFNVHEWQSVCVCVDVVVWCAYI